MGWITRVLPTAAGPGLIALTLWALWLCFDLVNGSMMSAGFAGVGLGGATSIIAIPFALAGMSLAERWNGALGWAALATVASKLFSMTLPGADSSIWVVMMWSGTFAVYLIAIAGGHGIKKAVRENARPVDAGEDRAG